MRKTEKKYKEFERLGQELGIPVPRVFLSAEVFDKDGKLVKRIKDRSHSFNRNYYNSMYSGGTDKAGSGSTFGAGFLTKKNISGNIGATTDDVNLYLESGAAYTTSGITIGTNDTAETFEDFQRGSAIPHGTGTGEMSYAESTIENPVYTAGTKTWDTDYIRYFNNNSGNDIIIAEVCLFSSSYLISRDILSSAITVTDAGQVKLWYTISMVFPY